MADAPAKASSSSRRWLFRLAWLLLAIGLVIPAPSGSPGQGTVGGSALYVYSKAVAWSEAVPGAPGSLGFAQAAILALALFSNIAFLYTLYLRDDRGVAAAWKAILLVALAVDAGVAALVPEFARLPAYWIWLASIAALAIGYVAIGGDDATQRAKARNSASVIDRGGVPPFVWVLLAATLFWIAVSAGNRAGAPNDAATAATSAPLTSYVNDPAHVLTSDEASQLSVALQKFEAETPSQIAVAIYRRAPAGSIDEFTIQAAERLPLGRAGLDTGAILFIFMEERIARLEVGYGLEGTLTDVDAHRILEAQLAPAFARGDYFGGLEATLNAIFANVQDAYKHDRMPSKVTVWKRQLKGDKPKTFDKLWRAVSGTGLIERIGTAFLLAIVGLILWSTVPQWRRLLRDLWRGITNLFARRSFSDGMESVDGSTIGDSLKLLVWTLGIILPAAGVIIIAGGGAFGGAGSLLHW